MTTKILRSVYADMFGPTTGDRVRLADTDIIIEVEKDFTTYGEEVKFGGGTGPAHGTFATSCTPGPWHSKNDSFASGGLSRDRKSSEISAIV